MSEDIMHLYETGSGEDWYLARSYDDAMALLAEHIGVEYANEEGVKQIDDNALWSMLSGLDSLPDALRRHEDVSIDLLVDGPVGDGWTHRVTAPARVWAAHFPRGPIASVNF
jgi:hypothetical protein